jgi:hypothetical protein
LPVPVRGAKQRALLALKPGQPVSADRLIDVLRGNGQAANPANALRAQIGKLRRPAGCAGEQRRVSGGRMPAAGTTADDVLAVYQVKVLGAVCGYPRHVPCSTGPGPPVM